MSKNLDRLRFFKTPAGNIIATAKHSDTTVSLLLKEGSWVPVPFGVSVETTWESWKLSASAIDELPPLPCDLAEI